MNKSNNLGSIEYYDPYNMPKVIIVSNTQMGYQNATGSLVKDLFTGWPKAMLAQVYAYSGSCFDFDVCDKYYHLSNNGDNIDCIVKQVKEFCPDILYLRLVDDPPIFMQFITKLMHEIDVPLITHIMDDWPERLSMREPELFKKQSILLKEILSRAYINLSISDKMSAAFEQRYGVHFKAISNYVDPDYWLDTKSKEANKKFIIRYTGSLAPDMQLESVLDIAKAVEMLQNEVYITFEIFVNKWFSKYTGQLKKIKGTVIKPYVSKDRYKEILHEADLLVLPVNFDELSLVYVRFSMANKLPEYLASGTPVLAYGPLESATIEYIYKSGFGEAVISKDIYTISKAIKKIILNKEKYEELAAQAKENVLVEFSPDKIRSRFQSFFIEAKNNVKAARELHNIDACLIGEYPRGSNIDFNETNVIAKYLGSEKKIMVNVGAHFGWSLSAFVKQGWKIYAFEPDEKNRAALTKNYGDNPLVKIDSRAVSNEIAHEMSFFTSTESTGISSLAPFHKTHKETAKVSVTTLRHFCEETNIDHIDFLLIDTEAYDLFVLKGLDWEKIRPDVIVCEFEDNKTKSLGYDFYDLANFLTDKGYKLLISEWHPIKRYGIRHDWRRLSKYPCKLANENAWGNIIAFKKIPDWQKLMPIINKEATPSTHSFKLIYKINRAIRRHFLSRLFAFYG